MENRKRCIVPGSAERHTCPICKKNDLKQLRGHIGKVHKEVPGVERRKLMKQTRINSKMCRLNTKKTSFMEFLLALQYLPVKLSMLKKMKECINEFRASWETNSLEPLSQKTKLLAWNAYKLYESARKKWVINEGNDNESEHYASNFKSLLNEQCPTPAKNRNPSSPHSVMPLLTRTTPTNLIQL